ncbi:hypothetical protein KC318_g5341 [Hortaea werneckii]|nr:hypothetical protein KC334_g5434 [Hortaea werneckii]KAI7025161.1 hypothetical protein KC355_g1144 [Hortaea werneckii]KAI7187052.1 hypothetical protein KC324_g7010 [Hortaea werneckii]KAI7584114.1 hypothetical protein KC316_g6883 [Hortaea werneckii]KAI7668333.1 hypothetical protein KC318_g5341 [Hortaea werneckii]
MANLAQLSIMIFVLLFTGSAHAALFCKDPTSDCKCSGLVPSLEKCTTIDPANSTCYPDGYAPSLDIIAKAIYNACDQFQTPDLETSLVDFYTYRYSPAEDADEGTISLAVMWWGTDRCAGSRDPKVAFPLPRDPCHHAFRSLAGPDIGYKYPRPGLCASRGGTGTDWCWTYYLDSSPRKHGFWALVVRDALDRAQDWAGVFGDEVFTKEVERIRGMLGGLDDEATLRRKLGMVNRAFRRFYGGKEVEGGLVRRRRRDSSDGLERGVDWGYDGVDDGDSSDVIVRDDDGGEYEENLQELANSPAGEFMMLGHEEESSAGDDGGDYEDELQELANQHAGEVMVVAREEEVRARHDDEYEDKIQALANEQAGSLMIVARQDEVDARHDKEYEDKLQELANEQAGSLMIVARDDDV